MKKGVFKAKTESGRIVEVVVSRDEVDVSTREGHQTQPGMIELFCPEFGSHVNVDASDPTLTRFTLVFPPLKLERLADSPFPEL